MPPDYALGVNLGTLAPCGATELFDQALHECHPPSSSTRPIAPAVEIEAVQDLTEMEAL